MIYFHRPPSFKDQNKILEEIKEILHSRWVVNGDYVRQLEEHFKNKFNVKYALACCNCTNGLIIAVKALNLTKDAIIGIPSFTWGSTEYAALCSTDWVEYIDIDRNSWLIDSRRVKNHYIDLEAVIAVDIFGNMCNMDYLEEGIPLIIDAAHGYGLSKLGQRGDIEVVSLAHTKLVFGLQGGIILTNNETYYNRMKPLVELSAKMTEINALIALYSASEYKNISVDNYNIIEAYRSMITVDFKEQYIPEETNHSVYAILLESKKVRDKIADNFRKNDIEVKIYYTPLSETNNTKWVYNRILALPVYKEVEKDVKFICQQINNI